MTESRWINRYYLFVFLLIIGFLAGVLLSNSYHENIINNFGEVVCDREFGFDSIFLGYEEDQNNKWYGCLYDLNESYLGIVKSEYTISEKHTERKFKGEGT